MQDLRLRGDNTERFGFRPLTNQSSPSSAVATAKRPVVAQDNNEFLRESLQVHNELRRRHGVEPLRLNNELSKLAQQWGEIEKSSSSSYPSIF
jgi:uncharacterized protein YkwD